jgi:SAM-dependent methyltransferase
MSNKIKQNKQTFRDFIWDCFEKIDGPIQVISGYIPGTYQYTIRKAFNPGSILELGCGKGWAWRYFANKQKRNTVSSIGVDISLPYLQFCRDNKLYGDVVQCNVESLPFQEKSFDVVIMLQLIEHLTKENGLKLIADAEKIARKQVILATPVGFLEYDFHLSGWEPQELQKLGYTVTGHGLKLPIPKGKLTLPFSQVSRFSCLFPFTYKSPRHAYQMVAIKRLS